MIRYCIGERVGKSYDYAPFKFIVFNEGLSYEESMSPSDEDRVEVSSGLYFGGKRKVKLPGFYLSPDNQRANIAFGSCRKPHDDGPDAFIQLDSTIRDQFSDPEKRPHVLFLGGDQIYADDVNDDVLVAAKSIAKLHDLGEILPGQTSPTDAQTDRRRFVQGLGFTSDKCENHLLSFGEYVAMYGLVWNRQNWKSLTGRNETVLDFVRNLDSVRRVLANTPTYMIFDDHDVTDDWFITNEWKSKVLSAAGGVRVIANALGAYVLFQGWGNDPTRMPHREIKSIIEDQTSELPAPRPASAFDRYLLNRPLGFWEFLAPTSPVSLFLDTRTQRAGSSFPITLKSDKSWSASKLEVSNKNMPFVLVAPGPVFNFPPIDQAQPLAVALQGPYTWDFESWYSNPENYRKLFEFLRSRQITKVLIVGGDVHYSYTALFSIANKEKYLGDPGAYQIDGLQITCSGLKNSTGKMWPTDTRTAAFITKPWLPGIKYQFLVGTEIYNGFDVDQFPARYLLDTPRYVVSKGQVHKTFVDHSSNTDHRPVAPSAHPDLVIALTIDSKMPKTQEFIGDHNGAFISVRQNDVEVVFTTGAATRYSL
jgi:hypothetical protein